MTRGNSAKTTRSVGKKPPIELVNPGTAGLVYDEDGHSVGGGQRVTITGDPDAVAMRQLKVGNLLAQRGDDWLSVRDGHLVDPDPEPGPPVDDTASTTPPPTTTPDE